MEDKIQNTEDKDTCKENIFSSWNDNKIANISTYDRNIIANKQTHNQPFEKQSKRKGANNAEYYYVEAFRIVDIANEVFGYDGWASSVIDITQDFCDEVNGRIQVGISAIVRITIASGNFHEDVGYGTGQGYNKGDVLEKARKGAVTDAQKRALRQFGRYLGGTIYDRQHLSNAEQQANDRIELQNTSQKENISTTISSYKNTNTCQQKTVSQPAITTNETISAISNNEDIKKNSSSIQYSSNSNSNVKKFKGMYTRSCRTTNETNDTTKVSNEPTNDDSINISNESINVNTLSIKTTDISSNDKSIDANVINTISDIQVISSEQEEMNKSREEEKVEQNVSATRKNRRSTYIKRPNSK